MPVLSTRPSTASSSRKDGGGQSLGSLFGGGSGTSTSASTNNNNIINNGSHRGNGGLRDANHIGSVVDDWPMYSSQPDDYVLGDIIGLGASSVVYQAAFQPLNGRACAVKVIDLEAFGRDTEELRRETQLMSLSKHPNVLRVRGCWVKGTKLHIATRLMSSGSLLDIMRFTHSDGFPEEVICAVLKQALQGLNYLHVNGWLHRDLKAANLLVDEDGTVLLGDFGVGVWVGDGNQVSGKRKSFVGTPCWMAPEVVERKHYNAKADIWSFGITALELSQGHAPRSRLEPVKVLMKTLQEDPPALDRTGGAHKYSKVFEDFVRQCLQKDPTKRPSAEKLLKHAFFKAAKPPRWLATSMLAKLPPLSQRQEKQRALSIASSRNQQSWDFGASPPASLRGLSANGTPRTPLSPSGSGFLPIQREGSHQGDPFAGFTASIASPGPSPWNSLRIRTSQSGAAGRNGLPSGATFATTSPGGGGTMLSIDGEHVIAVQGSDEEVESMEPESLPQIDETDPVADLATKFTDSAHVQASASSPPSSPRHRRTGSSDRGRNSILYSSGAPRRRSRSVAFEDSAPLSSEAPQPSNHAGEGASTNMNSDRSASTEETQLGQEASARSTSNTSEASASTESAPPALKADLKLNIA